LIFEENVPRPSDNELFPYHEPKLCDVCLTFNLQKIVSVKGAAYLNDQNIFESSVSNGCELCTLILSNVFEDQIPLKNKFQQFSLCLATREDFPGLLSSNVIVARNGGKSAKPVLGLYTDRGKLKCPKRRDFPYNLLSK
jgi:hypothetical protein